MGLSRDNKSFILQGIVPMPKRTTKKENQEDLGLEETLGYKLRKAREAASINLEDLGDQLCLSYSVIKAIEADQYFGEKNTIYMRGYIRAYARLVNFPQEEVQKVFVSQGLVEPLVSVDTPKFNFKQHSLKDKPMKIVTYSVIGILIFLVLLWRYLHH